MNTKASKPAPGVVRIAIVIGLLLPHSVPRTATGQQYQKTATAGADQKSETIEQLWEGSSWVNDRRTERLFDDADSLAGFFIHDWDGSTWIPISGTRWRPVFEDDVEWTVTEEWDGSAWAPESRRNRVYDDAGLLIRQTYQQPTDSGWVNWFRDLNAYEGTNRIEERRQIWDRPDWTDATLTTREYDDQDRDISYTVVRLDGGEPQNETRITTSYETEADGSEVIERISQRGESDGWVNESRRRTTTDTNERQVESTSFLWIESDWRKERRTTSTYDNAGNLMESMFYSGWPSTDWEPSTRLSYAYDGQNRITGAMTNVWHGGVETESKRSTYRYSNDGRRLDIDREQFQDGSWEFDLTQWTLYDDRGNEVEEGVASWDGTQFVNDRRDLHTYLIPTDVLTDQLPTTIDVVELSAYPNPFSTSSEIMFELDSAGKVNLTVFDILGRTVSVLIDGYQPAGRYLAYWMPTVGAGVYLVRLRTGRGAGTTKLVLSR